MKTGAWSPEEDAVLRAAFGRGDSPALVAEQLGRLVRSVGCRAQLLGIARKCWSADDDRRLGNLWGEQTVDELATLFGRTPMGVYQRAKKLGLPMGLPEGCWYLWEASKRTGVTVQTLRLICKRTKVRIRLAMACPSEGRRYPRHIVDSFDAAEAVKAWVGTETINGAARRRRVGTLRLIKCLAGVPGVPKKPRGRKKHWRIPTELIERALGRAVA